MLFNCCAPRSDHNGDSFASHSPLEHDNHIIIHARQGEPRRGRQGRQDKQWCVRNLGSPPRCQSIIITTNPRRPFLCVCQGPPHTLNRGGSFLSRLTPAIIIPPSCLYYPADPQPVSSTHPSRRSILHTAHLRRCALPSQTASSRFLSDEARAVQTQSAWRRAELGSRHQLSSRGHNGLAFPVNMVHSKLTL